MRRQIVQPKTQPRQQTNAYNCDRKSIFIYALYLVHFLFVFNFFRIGRGQFFRRRVPGLFGFGFFGLQTSSKGKCCRQKNGKTEIGITRSLILNLSFNFNLCFSFPADDV